MTFLEVKAALMQSGMSESDAEFFAKKQIARQEEREKTEQEAVQRGKANHADFLGSVKWDDADLIIRLTAECDLITGLAALKDFEAAFYRLVEKPHVVSSPDSKHGWKYDNGVPMVRLYQAEGVFAERREELRRSRDFGAFYAEAKSAEEAWRIHEAGDAF